MNYSDFQNMPSSEKITLALLSASKRLMGWTLHSGSIYKITSFPFAVITAIEDSGTAYSAVTSIGAITTSTYFLDHSTSTLYLRTVASDNPNSRFMTVTLRLNYSNVPITLPHDLASGFEVYWEPLIKSTSEFGVSIDTIAQTSEAIEGTGTLTLNNDFDFWPQYFDKLTFENQDCLLYSYHRELDNPALAHIIFKGKVEKKAYSKDTITFNLKDQFSQLKAPIALSTIGDLGARTGSDLAMAKQRMIIGRVTGNRPTNIDQVLSGYPVTGTISISVGSLSLTGSGTAFLSELSPDDTLTLSGTDYTIATVTSNTALTLTDPFTGTVALSGTSVTVKPDQPKRLMNRVFKVAGHAMREPSTVTTSSNRIDNLFVASTADMFDGDMVYIGTLGSGQLVQIQSVIGPNYIRLTTSLASIPAVGTSVTRPAVQNVRIDEVPLTYYRDYTFSASTGVLTLRSTAESNAAPIYQMGTTVTYSIGSRTVTGSGFKEVIHPGYMMGVVGQAEFFEVLSVESDTSLTLRTASTYASAGSFGRYKSLIYNPDSSVLTLDALGRTSDATTNGSLLRTAPDITKALLTDAGLGSSIDTVSFAAAVELAYQDVGIVVPEAFNYSSDTILRDVLNKINKSVFGALIQTDSFLFGYEVLQPKKPSAATQFSESDILSYSLTSTAEFAVKTTIVEYAPKEYDYLTKTDSVSTQQSTNNYANYLLKTNRSKTIASYLVTTTDANISAARWSLLLQNSTSRLSFATKMQGATLEIGDIIEIQHRKFFERYGSLSPRKLLLVESVARSGATVKVEATDLSNTFARVAGINDNTTAWSSASETEKLYGGYYTDDYGLVSNDSESFATNLIW